MPRSAVPLLALGLGLLSLGAWHLLDGEPGARSAAEAPDALAPGEHGRAEGPQAPTLPGAEAAGTRNQPETGAAPATDWLEGGLLPGLCVQHLNSAPLPGVAVTFLQGGAQRARATSNAEGRFRVELPPGGFDEVRVDPPAGWWCVSRELKEDGYRVRLAPGKLGPLRGLLLDEVTHEPVPHYVVRVVGAGDWSETVESDAEGRFQTGVLFARGLLQIFGGAEEFGGLWSGQRLARHEHVPAGAAPPRAPIPIPIGPTYSLRLEKPASLALSELRAYLTGAAWLEEASEAVGDSSRVRPAELPWVRFQEADPWLEEPQLVVTDTGGRWFGHAAVDASPGIHKEPVTIELQPMLRLRGRVFDAEGEPVARARVEFSPAEHGVRGAVRETTSNGRGLFIIESLRPGRYQVFARHSRAGMARETVELSEQGPEEVAVHLEPYLVAGDVSGVVRSLSGEFRGPTSLHLSPQGPSEGDLPARSLRLQWERAGTDFQAPFRFEGVAHGQYELLITIRGASFDVEPVRQEFAPPRAGLEILVRDDKPRRRPRFMVLDAATGAWLHEARVRVLDEQGRLAYEGSGVDGNAGRMFAKDEPFQWKVTHPGYHPAYGDRAAFDELSRESRYHAVVRLETD